MCAEVAALPGVTQVQYDVGAGVFSVQADDRVSLEALFTAVFIAGKKMGREYFPELIL